ncbi:retrovirus-related Pol polyprotein from transposon RE1 [Hevea brasiliensis]|uniref:retrovirus-related Pol polyprotein from transposon RE1 n=1 Tax=Hevea brasiliensis TaxID=3981 RepID=UPI0025E899E9|nr:retrovirus-related Pol polyprotein from transposon RE1 [Hevea brasiliensis]
MSKEIVEAFLYASSAKDLWDELAQRFGESNGPLIYQIKREICSLSQGNMSLINYFTKLKKLWDELACLKQFPVCECEASKEIAEMENNTKLIQFLMGLNPSYDHIRNQILLMDPFPPVNKAYSMALQVEKQREINTFSLDSTESSVAMLAKGLSSKRIHEGNKNQNKRKDGIKKEDKYCQHCKTTGHFSESCFNVTPYPSDPWTRKLLAIGRMDKGLYKLVTSSFNQARHPSVLTTFEELCQLSNNCRDSVNAISSHVSDSYLWHQRLGHASESTFSHIAKIKFNGNHFSCDICPLAKQQRLPFPKSTINSSAIFQLLHLDLWGPYKIKSLQGASYFLTIVDDYSRSTWTYLLADKFQVPSTITTFLKFIKNHFEGIVKIIRTDNGTEFINHECEQLFVQNGILHQRTCTYTPQQNGVVERKHKHLLQVVRALLFQSNLPQKFWGHTILHATYIINRLPTAVLNWKSPYEVLHSQPPDYQILRTFECLCYGTNTKPSKAKFEPRAIKSIFLGHAMGYKAYKLMDLETQTIYMSRDVKFHEHIFPYKSIH